MRRLVLGAASVIGVLSISFAIAAAPSAAPSSPSSSPSAGPPSASARAPRAIRPVRPVVVATHPHDDDAFTQGLVFRNGELFESTGMYGQSTLRAVDPASGRVRTRTFLDPRLFGEGMTIFGDKIFVLSWREHTCLVYSLDFIRREQFSYEGEGWGLTHDATNLIMSDGTSVIRFIDPSTFNIVRTIEVREDGQPLVRLNELELIHGLIWANIWETNRIVQIDPANGTIVGSLDLSGIDGGQSRNDPDAVLNGIAWDEARDRIFVTGKRWPKLFEIRVPSARAKD